MARLSHKCIRLRKVDGQWKALYKAQLWELNAQHVAKAELRCWEWNNATKR